MYNLVALAAVGLTIIGQGAAYPAAASVSAISSRDYTGYDKCSQDQKDKINRALQDAAVMARQHSTNWGSITYRSSPAYLHYFSDDEFDTGVDDMLNALGQQSQPPKPGSGQSGAGDEITLNQFNVHITCEETADCSDPKAGTKSLVITDSNAATDSFTPAMRFCPQFFDANEPRTKNNLDSLPYTKNPRRGVTSWCKSSEKFSYFEVAGTTVLHELTHLNEAGNRAHLADRDDGVGGRTQGTDDIYTEKNYPSDPVAAARKLHDNWANVINKNLPKEQWPPYVEKLNAESYAASATEWWFMSQCDIDSINGN